MVRIIVNYKSEEVVNKIRKLGKVIYKSDIIYAIGADVPRANIEKIKKLEGVKRITFPDKADILS